MKIMIPRRIALFLSIILTSKINYAMDLADSNNQITQKVISDIFPKINLKNLLKNRRISRAWKTQIDMFYQICLTKEEQFTENNLAAYREKTGDEQEINTLKKEGWITATDPEFENWQTTRYAEQIAISHNLIFWLHNFLKNKKTENNTIARNYLRGIRCFANPLYLAVQQGKEEIFDLYIGLGNYDVWNDIPLREAIEKDRTDLAKKLIIANAPLMMGSPMCEVPFHYDAFEHAKEKNNNDLIEFIKKRKNPKLLQDLDLVPQHKNKKLREK